MTLPDIRGREQILRPYAQGADWPGRQPRSLPVARRVPGADLANLVNEAALAPPIRNARLVEMIDFERAKDKIYMGLSASPWS